MSEVKVNMNMIMQLARLIDLVNNHQPFHRANTPEFLIQKGVDMGILELSKDNQYILITDGGQDWLHRLRVQVAPFGNGVVN